MLTEKPKKMLALSSAKIGKYQYFTGEDYNQIKIE